jgi:hypothetical protein
LCHLPAGQLPNFQVLAVHVRGCLGFKLPFSKLPNICCSFRQIISVAQGVQQDAWGQVGMQLLLLFFKQYQPNHIETVHSFVWPSGLRTMQCNLDLRIAL